MAIGSTLTPVGISTDKHYRHEQNEAIAVWTVYHNLNKYPTVHTFFLNDMMYGKINYINENTLTITFCTPCKGMAICN